MMGPLTCYLCWGGRDGLRRGCEGEASAERVVNNSSGGMLEERSVELNVLVLKRNTLYAARSGATILRFSS